MDNSIEIFEEENKESSKQKKTVLGDIDMSSVRSMVKQMQEIEDQIKKLREDKKELISDFVETYKIPKKEVSEAIKMLKNGIDPTITEEVYSNIADLVETP